MTMHFHDLASRAAADGVISPDEILELRRAGWADGSMALDEAEALFVANNQVTGQTAEWTDFFVEALVEFLTANGSPPGYIDEDQAEWLIEQIEHDGVVGSMAELELLARLFERAVSTPESLRRFALDEIEHAVLSGEGPTRGGGELAPGTINQAECALLRRFIFASGGDRPAGVSRAEAEMLFRIKDASLGSDNADEWQTLFVQGVGNYLQGFGGAEQLSAARAAELETFMNDTAVSLSGFFSRMVRSNVWEGAQGFVGDDDHERDYNAEADAAHQVTESEDVWLQARIDANGQLDPMDQALLDFLAEE